MTSCKGEGLSRGQLQMWRREGERCIREGRRVAQLALTDGLKRWGRHPAVAGVFVANEIPSDMVRWMGVMKVRRALEALIELGRSKSPKLLYAYANFPTTEYMEPDNADFTAMNV